MLAKCPIPRIRKIYESFTDPKTESHLSNRVHNNKDELGKLKNNDWQDRKVIGSYSRTSKRILNSLWLFYKVGRETTYLYKTALTDSLRGHSPSLVQDKTK